MFVTEDIPEEWMNLRKILKPIFNATCKDANLRTRTKLVHDKLVIDGCTYTVAPINNINEVNDIVNTQLSCQRSDSDNRITVFLGSHSINSNLYGSDFTINNITYNTAEQYIQSEKASLFNDDVTQARIMKETNPSIIKKLGSKVKNFKLQCWRAVCENVAYCVVHAKFTQNTTLLSILKNTGNTIIVEGSPDPYWGTSVHLHDKKALDR